MFQISSNFIGLIAILSTIALPIGLGMYIAIRSKNQRHKERMELIKQGILPLENKEKPAPNKYKTLRDGMLFLGIALGLILPFIFYYNNAIIEEDIFGLFIGGSVLLFMGLSYVIYFFIVKNKNMENERN